MTGILLIDCWEPPVWKPWVHQLYDNIIAVIKQHEPTVVVDASYGDATKSHVLAPYITTHFTDLDTLQEFAKSNLVQDWICMGRDWHECVHYRPVGLIALARAGIETICITGTIGKTTGDFVDHVDFEQDQLQWVKINKTSWKLETLLT